MAIQYGMGTVWAFQAEQARNSVMDPFKAVNVARFASPFKPNLLSKNSLTFKEGGSSLPGATQLRLSIWLEQSARDLMTEQFKMDEMHQLVANDMPLSLMNLVTRGFVLAVL